MNAKGIERLEIIGDELAEIQEALAEAPENKLSDEDIAAWAEVYLSRSEA